jgi:Iap family predicted aminopeptidase
VRIVHEDIWNATRNYDYELYRREGRDGGIMAFTHHHGHFSVFSFL